MDTWVYYLIVSLGLPLMGKGRGRGGDLSCHQLTLMCFSNPIIRDQRLEENASCELGDAAASLSIIIIIIASSRSALVLFLSKDGQK